jgi:hypothetical protein
MSRPFVNAVSTIVAATLVTAFMMMACTQVEPQIGDPDFDRDPALNVDNRSAKGEQRSHNMGQNCMNCHQPRGPGRGLFTVAATIYDAGGNTVANPSLELYTAPPNAGGTLVIAVQGDGLGNVFTTDPLPFPDKDLFPVVKSGDGALINQMPFPTGSGACNQCHRADKRVEVLPPRQAAQ